MENEQAVQFELSVAEVIGTGVISNAIPEVIDYEPDVFDELESNQKMQATDQDFSNTSR